jgi:hypothetical protein
MPGDGIQWPTIHPSDCLRFIYMFGQALPIPSMTSRSWMSLSAETQVQKRLLRGVPTYEPSIVIERRAATSGSSGECH